MISSGQRDLLYFPKQPFTVGHSWRAALVVFFNYGVDTGTVFKVATQRLASDKGDLEVGLGKFRIA
jgi:hypothetical protein